MRFSSAAAVLLGIAVSTTPVLAQSGLSTGAFTCSGSSLPAESAEELLTKAQRSYSNLTSVRARFLQDSYLDALDLSEMSSGQMWFEKPGRMKWHYSDPEEQVFILKNNTVWLYQVRDKQVLVQDFEEVFLSDLPVAFLMGVGTLQDQFTLKQTCRTTGGTLFTLLPKESESENKSDLRQFQLLVDQKHFEPIGALVTDISGNRTKLLFDERTRNEKLPAATFAVEYPRGVDIQDQRKQKRAS